MNKSIIACTILALGASVAMADTTQTGPSVYEVDQGVTFDLGNFASSDYLFEWIGKSGFFTGIVDPTIVLTIGETYTFLNQTSVHPFIITDESLPVQGTDGDHFRTTSDLAVMNAATLQPIADFTSDPGGSDPISWTPEAGDVGTYYYTCRITGHLNMTGKIVVVSGAVACPADLNGDGALNFFDVSAFLSAFSAGDPIADFNGDGNYNFFDVSAFLGAFAAGCP